MYGMEISCRATGLRTVVDGVDQCKRTVQTFRGFLARRLHVCKYEGKATGFVDAFLGEIKKGQSFVLPLHCARQSYCMRQSRSWFSLAYSSL